MNYFMAYALVILLVLLATIAICFPRRRIRYQRPKPVRIEYDRPRLPSGVGPAA